MNDVSRSTEPEDRIPAHDLRNIGLFGALPERVLDDMAAELAVVELPAGTYVFREGEPASCMFVVVQGDVEVLKRSRAGVDSRVAVLGPGDWFGEMSIIDVQPRSATVLTVSPTRLLRITAADLDRLYRSDLKSFALIVQNIARELSRRLRVADGILADLIANVTETYVKRRT